MRMNFIARARNKIFWVTLIPALLLAAEKILEIFGIGWQSADLSNQLVDAVGAVFAVLVILGVAVDPTTAGISDTDQAMTYLEPRKEIDVAADEGVA